MATRLILKKGSDMRIQEVGSTRVECRKVNELDLNEITTIFDESGNKKVSVEAVDTE
jgi:hypothetical protein